LSPRPCVPLLRPYPAAPDSAKASPGKPASGSNGPRMPTLVVGSRDPDLTVGARTAPIPESRLPPSFFAFRFPGMPARAVWRACPPGLRAGSLACPPVLSDRIPTPGVVFCLPVPGSRFPVPAFPLPSGSLLPVPRSRFSHPL
jgi:hypothetical protein